MIQIFLWSFGARKPKLCVTTHPIMIQQGKHGFWQCSCHRRILSWLGRKPQLHGFCVCIRLALQESRKSGIGKPAKTDQTRQDDRRVARREDQGVFHSTSIDGTLLFSWGLKEWEAWATRHIEERLLNGKMHCWLDDYANSWLKTENKLKRNNGKPTEASRQ